MQAVEDHQGEKSTTSDWQPTAADRCDWSDCPAQAYVKVFGVPGELMFCNHHYNRAKSKMEGFAYKTEDRRDLLR